VRISLSSIAQADEKASSTFTSVSNLINRPYRLLRYSTFDKMLIWSVPSTPGYRQSSTLLNLSFSLVSSLMKISPAVAEGSVSVYALVKFPVNKWICFCVSPCNSISNGVLTPSSSDGERASASCRHSPPSLDLRSFDSSSGLSKQVSRLQCVRRVLSC
jgi:hypothetical protein